MTTAIDFHYDFGSPNSYLAHLRVKDIEARKAVQFNYVPILLGGVFKSTGNQSPFLANQSVKNKFKYMQTELKRFLSRYKLADQFKLNHHFPVNTLMVMRGAVAAQVMGDELYHQYIDVIFEAMWLRGLKMDDVAVITEVMTDAGLPAQELITNCQSAEVKQGLIDNTQASVDHGNFGAPSFYVDGELYFGKETLAEIEEQL